MPIYEFKCKKCSEVFERIRPVSSGDSGSFCPKCHAGVGQRIMSVPSGFRMDSRWMKRKRRDPIVEFTDGTVVKL